MTRYPSGAELHGCTAEEVESIHAEYKADLATFRAATELLPSGIEDFCGAILRNCRRCHSSLVFGEFDDAMLDGDVSEERAA